jgi:hypothetical protein
MRVGTGGRACGKHGASECAQGSVVIASRQHVWRISDGAERRISGTQIDRNAEYVRCIAAIGICRSERHLSSGNRCSEYFISTNNGYGRRCCWCCRRSNGIRNRARGLKRTCARRTRRNCAQPTRAPREGRDPKPTSNVAKKNRSLNRLFSSKQDMYTPYSSIQTSMETMKRVSCSCHGGALA